jgi:HK97 family phage major capsid protein
MESKMKHMFGLLAGLAALQSGGVLPFGIFANAAIERMRAQQQQLTEESEALIAKADEEERELTEEELGVIQGNKEKVDNLSRQITAREGLGAVAAVGPGRKTSAEASVSGAGNRVPATARDSRRHNFVSLGEMAMGVRAHVLRNHESEACKKVMAAATTYGNEGVGADGGFLVAPEFSEQIWQKVEAEENLMTRCRELVTGSNSMSIPKDETTPWGTNGIRVYWEGEAGSITPSKPVFDKSDLKLTKLTALVPITDENLEDATGLDSWLQAIAPGRMAAKINTGIISGTGVGQPLGILNSGSLISVAKETSQAADTVLFPNINKMWARMYAPWRRNSIWLINQDIEPQLDGMAFDWQATGGKVPVYLPAGGAATAPYASIKNRPVVPVEACSTLGDQGDIILVDLLQYWMLRKAQGVRTDTSIHLYFDQSITAFRFVFRLNGQPAWSKAITPQNGSLTRSWAVTLDAR